MKLVIVGLVMAIAIIMTTNPMVTYGDESGLCRMTKDGLDACKPSVTTAKPPVPPSKYCCDAIAEADIKCLCDFKNYPNVLKLYGVDPNLALKLPEKCKLGEAYRCSN